MANNKQTVREALNACMDASWYGQPVPTGQCGQALIALDNLYDKAAVIEQLEGMKKDEVGFQPMPDYNAAIDAVIKLVKGER